MLTYSKFYKLIFVTPDVMDEKLGKYLPVYLLPRN